MSSEIKSPLVKSLMEKINREKSSLAKFADAAGLPRDRVYKWIQQGTNPKSADEKAIEAYLRGEISMDKHPQGAVKQTGGASHTTIKIDGGTEMTLIEALLAEKEARRQEAVARLDKADQDKDKLMELLELSLKRLENISLSTLSQVESHIHREAKREADGDSKLQKQILEEVNKKAGEFRKALVGGDRSKAGSS